MKKSLLPWWLMGISLFLFSQCSPFVSTITLPPYQEFVLGADQASGFQIELNNLSNLPIDVATRDAGDKKTSGFGLSEKGKTKMGVSPNEKAILLNPNPDEVKVQVKLREEVKGMQFQSLSLDQIINPARVKEQDLAAFISSSWVGTLTYIDFQSGKKVGIPCNLRVTKIKSNSYQVEYLYPEEPQANGKSKITIEEEGQVFEGRRVIEAAQKGDFFVIRTVAPGKDDNKKVVLFYTYSFNEKELRIKKEFQGLGSDELQFRNEYAFTR
ncbi:MAG: hypothetical protein AAFU64_06370 [Bacteroidota bacterium]